MKRLLLLYVFLLSVFMASAQSRYTVYKCQGDAHVMKFKTETWTKLSKNESLSLLDLVKLGEASSIVILDTKTRKLYKSHHSEEMSVKYRIDEAIKAADRVTADLNRELLSELKEQETQSKGHTRIAAAFRGEGDPARADSLAAFVNEAWTTLNEDRNCVVFPDGSFSSDDFDFDCISGGDGECWMKVSNRGDREAIINVVRFSSDGKASLCYEFDYESEVSCIILAGGAEVVLDQYRFAEAEEGERFMLLVTDSPYDTHALQMLLKQKKL